MNRSNKHVNWLNSLQALAVVGVIIIYISTPIVKAAFGNNMCHWWIGNLADSLVRFSLPLFLMISGATLLSREYKPKDYYRKQLTLILLPLIFYMLVYWLAQWIITPTHLRPSGLGGIISWGADLFSQKGVSRHFWFIYMMLFLCLVAPIVGAFVRKLKPEMLVFLLAAWIVMCVISHSFSIDIYTWSLRGIVGKLYIYLLYLGYMVMGYYFYNIFYVSKNVRLTASILYLITAAVAVMVLYYTSKAKSYLDLTVYSYLNLNTIIQTAAVFIAFKHTNIKNKWLAKIIYTISDYSYGVYLVFILIIGVCYNFGISWTMAHPLISLPVLFILTLLGSLSVVFILRKIPYGKYISG